MSLSPFTRGRLALSAPAIKTIAKALATQDPIHAVTAGLRVHNGNMPFEVNEEPARDLTITGLSGSGCLEIAYGFAYGAAQSGFRVLTVSFTSGLLWKGDLNAVVWGEDPDQDGAMIRRGPRTRARAFHLAGDEGIFRATPQGIETFLRRALEDVTTRQTSLIMPFLGKLPRQEACAYQAALLHGLSSVREHLGDVVLILQETGFMHEDIKFLDAHAGGVIKVDRKRAQSIEAKEGDLCLFGKYALPGTDDFQAGEFLVGTHGDRRDPRLMPKITGPYTEKAAHEFHETVIRALNRIYAEPNVPDLTYIERLELVSKACGFQNWHAAEAQGRGFLDTVQSMLTRRKSG